MWPVFVHILNLPPELRYPFDYSLLATVIPCPKCPSDLGAFLKPVFDKVAQLFDKGFLLSDGTTVHTVVDLMVMDYQAQAKVLCMKAQGALQGCHLRTINGHYVYDLRKVVYLNNRAYIEPNDHPLRSASGYFSQQPNDSDLPEPRSREDIIDRGRESEAIRREIDAVRMIARDLKDHRKMTGVLCPPIYCNSSSRPGVRLGLGGTVPIDFMHFQRNVLVHVLQCLTGDPGTVCEHIIGSERDHGRFLDLWPSNGDGESDDEPVPGPWQLSREEMKIADERASPICLPPGFVLKSGPLFSNYLKIHRISDWLRLVTAGVLKLCIRRQLSDQQRRVLFRLLDCLRLVAAPAHPPESRDALESLIHTTLGELKLCFPVSLQVVMFHLLHHSVAALRTYGTVYSTWMFGCERLMGMLSRRAYKKRFPEATVMETMSVQSACMLRRLQLPQDSPLHDIDPLHPRESFHLVVSEAEDNEEFNRRLTEYVTQHVAGRASGYLYGEAQTDTLRNEDYGHLVDFFREYHTDFGELAATYDREKETADDPSFPDMGDWMPQDNLAINEERIRLLWN